MVDRLGCPCALCLSPLSVPPFDAEPFQSSLPKCLT
jgi:hypothetical protein